MADREAPDATPVTPHPRRSTEGSGCGERRHPESRYVIKRLGAGPHYVVRLRLGDLVVSWTIPEPPSLTHGEKRLAIRADEEHTPGPEGSDSNSNEPGYDSGRVDNLGDLPWEQALAEGTLSVRLTGTRLSGVFVFVRAHRSANQEQWLLITKTDETGEQTARLGHTAARLPLGTQSAVATGPGDDAR